MIRGLIGQKLGMTRVFDEDGNHVPVTVLRAGPCVVLQVRDEERDGYRAVQLGYLEDGVKPQRLNRAQRGHQDKAGAPPVKVIREFGLDDDEEAEPGSRVTVEAFEGVERVDVTGTTKGRGFQGVMHRHGFKGGKASHGSMHHRRPGSVGSSAFPSRVLPGAGMPGQMGAVRNSQQNLEVVKVDAEEHLIMVKGSVAGPKKGYVFIRPSVRGS